MLTRNHWELAKHISCQKGILSFDRLFFLLGSIMPDINILTYLKGHHAGKRLSWTKKRLSHLMRKPVMTPLLAYRLGIVMHYLADCFTLTHNAGFYGTVTEHLNYEKALCPQVREALKEKHSLYPEHGMNPCDMERIHERYLREATGTRTDSAYIFETARAVFCGVYSKKAVVPLPSAFSPSSSPLRL